MTIWMTAAAFACGGTFCGASPSLRVEQTAERVVFAMEDDRVETHVQVSYSGAAEEFAWIVPVPSVPEILLGNQRLFDALDASTSPQFVVDTVRLGTCKPARILNAIEPDCPQNVCESSPDLVIDTPEDVAVVATTAVGPYESVVLQATDSDTLVAWLSDRDFNTPDTAAERLQPYLDSGSYFVALRLRNGATVSEMVPLAFRYEGSEATIPLQLTGVAADDDMRLHVWVLGAHRAVPRSYLHVTINPFAVDWWNQGRNYDEVISRAADEAGGQAFATDSVLPTTDIEELMAQPVSISSLRNAEADPEAFLAAFVRAGFAFDADTGSVLARHVDVPSAAIDNGFDDLGWWSCVSNRLCVANFQEIADEMSPVDVHAFTDDLEETWLAAMTRSQELLDRHPVVTRLRSSMGPDEMTVDPSFTFNDAMPLVPRERRARTEVDCGRSRYRYLDAPRTFIVPDGRRVPLPSAQSGSARLALLGAAADLAAETIEETSENGPVLIRSRSAEIEQALADIEGEAGCGCAHAGGGSWVALLPLGLLGRRRRRR